MVPGRKLGMTHAFELGGQSTKADSFLPPQQCGYILPFAVSATAALIASINNANYNILALTTVTQAMMKMADMAHLVCVREVYAPTDDLLDPWTHEKIPGRIRLFSDCAGIVGDVATNWKETEPGAIIIPSADAASYMSLGLAIWVGKSSSPLSPTTGSRSKDLA